MWRMGPLGIPWVSQHALAATHTQHSFWLLLRTEFGEPELHALKVLPLDVPIKQEETHIKTYLYTTEECRETHLRQKLTLANERHPQLNGCFHGY